MAQTITDTVALIGCGRLGSAILDGWRLTGAIAMDRLIILTPSKKASAEAARAEGARINPPLEALTEADAVVLAVKPAKWREAAGPLIEYLRADAVILSVMAGVRSAQLSGAFEARPIARVMPTTGVAAAQGIASCWSGSTGDRVVAHALFDRISDVVDLDEEALIDAATAVSGSGPAYVFAFIQALAEAGVAVGLSPDDATRLARGVLRSAAAGTGGDQSLQALIAQVASPGGTTEAGLRALAAAGMGDAVRAAVDAALARALELSSEI